MPRSGVACYQTIKSGVRSHTMHAQAQAQTSLYWLRAIKKKLATRDFFYKTVAQNAEPRREGPLENGKSKALFTQALRSIHCELASCLLGRIHRVTMQNLGCCSRRTSSSSVTPPVWVQEEEKARPGSMQHQVKKYLTTAHWLSLYL